MVRFLQIQRVSVQNKSKPAGKQILRRHLIKTENFTEKVFFVKNVEKNVFGWFGIIFGEKSFFCQNRSEMQLFGKNENRNNCQYSKPVIFVLVLI